MNRRSFLVLAVAGLGVVGCGKQPAATAPEVTPETRASTNPSGTSAGAPLHAPPLAASSGNVANSAPRLPNRLEIPAIDVDTPVVELGWSEKKQDGQIFSEWDVAAYAAGWHKNSALPGEGGNVVMSGHNNILGAVFRELDQLKRGDAITVWMNNRLYDYAVEQVMVLPNANVSEEQRIANARWIGPFDDERLTLVSCWPRNNNTHRIVVIARPPLAAHSTQ